MRFSAIFAILGFALILPAGRPFAAEPVQKPHLLDLTPLPTQRYDRLTPDAKKHYDQAMALVDRVCHKSALDYFIKAGEAEPDNDYLQLSIAQLARYLGDTSWGKDSQDYYDKAAASLKKMASSPRLNPRERERAQTALDTVLALRQSVGERDEKRQQYGMAIAKQYAKEAYKDKQEKKYTEQERKERQEEIKQMYQKSLGLVGTTVKKTSTNKKNSQSSYKNSGSRSYR